MTAIPADELAGRTCEVRFAHVAASVIAWIFAIPGMIIGGLWRGSVFCGLAMAYGFCLGAGIPWPDRGKQQAPPS
jgi:hypothetical protein